MSKCGLCGVDFGHEVHMVLECKANMIPKNLYERMCAWMANEDNPEDFYEMFLEDVEDIASDSLRQQRIEEMAEVHQKEEAFDIMYELHHIYNGTEHK